MTEQEREISLALLKLCGWHVGMQLHPTHEGSKGGTVVQVTDQTVWVRNEDGQEYAWSRRTHKGLPSLRAWPNYGVWLMWVAEQTEPAVIDLGLGDGGWVMGIQYGVDVLPGSFPHTLLTAYCQWCSEEGKDHELPPFVLDWWRDEQGESL